MDDAQQEELPAIYFVFTNEPFTERQTRKKKLDYAFDH